VRIVVTQSKQIVAGMQLLMRPLPFVGAVGYVTKGPLFTSDDPTLTEFVINELHQVSKAHHVRYLVMQPPNNGESLACQLPHWGFRLGSIAVAPTATVLVDLTKNLDDILAQMRKKTRYGIRRGLREGVTVREGTEDDMPTFYRILVATSQRRQFSLHPEEYFAKMWQVFHPWGYIKLFLVEYDGEAVSAHLVIPFGDTVIAKRGGWTGCYGRCRPNEMLEWATIKWAKSQGYRYYDLEGIDPKAARAIVRGEPLSGSLTQSVTSFKLGFGGQVVLYPEPYDYVYDPLLRWVYSKISTPIGRWSSVKKILNRLSRRQMRNSHA
jgi:lipid II:glycine glycyltransferase (peptidoglycan interpeptide bridge formation enzyme)